MNCSPCRALNPEFNKFCGEQIVQLFFCKLIWYLGSISEP